MGASASENAGTGSLENACSGGRQGSRSNRDCGRDEAGHTGCETRGYFGYASRKTSCGAHEGCTCSVCRSENTRSQADDGREADAFREAEDGCCKAG